MANHLGPFPEAPDWPERQDQALLAVGVQQSLHGLYKIIWDQFRNSIVELI